MYSSALRSLFSSTSSPASSRQSSKCKVPLDPQLDSRLCFRSTMCGTDVECRGTLVPDGTPEKTVFRFLEWVTSRISLRACAWRHRQLTWRTALPGIHNLLHDRNPHQHRVERRQYREVSSYTRGTQYLSLTCSIALAVSSSIDSRCST